MRNNGLQPCACGCLVPHPGRRHHFWDCPVAAAVRSTLAAQLGGQQPTRQQLLWLIRYLQVHAGAWDASCLAAALAAMDGGRRQLAARLLHACQAADGPSSSRHPPPPPPLPAQLVPAAQRHAVARFWVMLQDFSFVGTAPHAWHSQLPAKHPFICWDPQAHRLRPTAPPDLPPRLRLISALLGTLLLSCSQCGAYREELAGSGGVAVQPQGSIQSNSECHRGGW